MRYSIQIEKMIKWPLMLAVVVAFAATGSYAVADGITHEADGITQNESHSDSKMAAKNWNNADGPDTYDVAPSNDVGMVAEEWRSLDQIVTHNDSYLAAKNWNNTDGSDTYDVAPSNDVDMAAENWRETR